MSLSWVSKASRNTMRFALAGVLGSLVAMHANADSLTLYSAQHEQLTELLAKDFEQASGISVRVRDGEGPALAAQLITEGSASPADVYFTENSPELMLLEEKGLLAPVGADTLKVIPSRFDSPTGAWVGVVARENVLAYNTVKVQAAQLPASLFDLAQPQWKGKVGIAPSDADFLPLVSAVLAEKGHDATIQWLKGMKTNSQIFDDDEGVVAAVNRGGVATGLINNYYWARLHIGLGDAATHSAIHHFGNGDVGALVVVSGAAILKSSKNIDAAQKFLAYLVSERAQKVMATTHIDFEYPLRAGVAADPILKPFDQLNPPAINVEKLGDDSQAAKLLREAGLL